MASFDGCGERVADGVRLTAKPLEVSLARVSARSRGKQQRSDFRPRERSFLTCQQLNGYRQLSGASLRAHLVPCCRKNAFFAAAP